MTRNWWLLLVFSICVLAWSRLSTTQQPPVSPRILTFYCDNAHRGFRITAKPFEGLTDNVAIYVCGEGVWRTE